MQASLPPSRKSSRGGAKKSIASLSSEEPSLVLRTSRNDDDVTLAADPLFAAEAELYLALEHPYDLLICVTVRLDMDACPDGPPYDHPLVSGENAAADLVADLPLK